MDSLNASPATDSRRVAISLEMDWPYKWHLEIYAGCQRFADEAGWDCVITPAVHRELNTPGNGGFDGILARASQPLAEAAETSGVPVVNVWINSPTKLPSVFADQKAAGIMAAEHLLSLGFRQFGFLGEQREPAVRTLLRGFADTLNREGFSPSTYRFPRNSIGGNAPGWAEFVSDLENWIDSWETPIGILVSDDLNSRYLVNICHSKNLHVSQEVALVSIGNEPNLCEAPMPTLTSIDMGYGQIGYCAAAMLDRLMSGGTPPAEPILVPPTELAPRQSTDSYAATGPQVASALQFIANHCHQGRMLVDDVAEAVSSTRRTLERRFRQELGRGIAEEITRLRLERAKCLLVETNALVKEVAEQCGFRTANHFYRVFSRVEGIPPIQYREARQKIFTAQALD